MADTDGELEIIGYGAKVMILDSFADGSIYVSVRKAGGAEGVGREQLSIRIPKEEARRIFAWFGARAHGQ